MKNIWNTTNSIDLGLFGNVSSTSGGVSGNIAIFGSTSNEIVDSGYSFSTVHTINATFFKENVALDDDQQFSYSLFKIGDFVTLCLAAFVGTMDNSKYYISDDAIPAEYWPDSIVSNPVATIDNNVYDADIIGLLLVYPDGRIHIQKEAGGTSGAFNSSSSGFDSISVSWRV